MSSEPTPVTKSRPDPLGAAWRFLAAPQALMAWLGLLALALAFAAFQTKLSTQMLNPSAGWLATSPSSAGQPNTFWLALESFDLFHSLWFYGLIALIMLSLLVRAVDSAEFAWRANIRREWTAEAFGSWGAGRAQHAIASAQEPDIALKTIQTHLVTKGYRWFSIPGLAWPNAVACHRPAALWARPMAYGAALAVLVGVAILSQRGWQHDDWQPSPGQTVAVGYGLPYEVQFQEFALGEMREGMLPQAHSRVTWRQEGDALKQAQVSSGRPAHWKGVAVRQVGFIPALTMRAWDGDGRLLALQPAGQEPGAPGEIELVFPSVEAQPYILIPALDEAITLALDLDGPQGRPALRAARIAAGEGQAVELGVLSESGTLEGEGLRLDIDLDYRPILRIDHRPGMELVMGGAALLLLCLLVGWLAPAHTLWIAAGPDGQGGSDVYIVTPAFCAAGRGLAQLLNEVKRVLAHHD